jgi:hypothetical protein
VFVSKPTDKRSSFLDCTSHDLLGIAEEAAGFLQGPSAPIGFAGPSLSWRIIIATSLVCQKWRLCAI